MGNSGTTARCNYAWKRKAVVQRQAKAVLSNQSIVGMFWAVPSADTSVNIFVLHARRNTTARSGSNHSVTVQNAPALAGSPDRIGLMAGRCACGMPADQQAPPSGRRASGTNYPCC